MIMNVITFMFQCLTYIVVRLDDMKITETVSWYDVLFWFMIISTCLWIVAGLTRSSGRGTSNN